MPAVDALLERGLPASIDAERYVLGSILLDDSLFVQVASVLEAEDFSLEKHRRVFLRMGELSTRAERIDRLTVAEELMKHGQLEACDGVGYLVSLDDGLLPVVVLGRADPSFPLQKKRHSFEFLREISNSSRPPGLCFKVP